MDNSSKRCPYYISESPKLVEKNEKLHLSTLLNENTTSEEQPEKLDFHKFKSKNPISKPKNDVSPKKQLTLITKETPIRKASQNNSKRLSIDKITSLSPKKLSEKNKEIEFKFDQNNVANKCVYNKELLMKHFWENNETKQKAKENDDTLLGKIGVSRLSYILLDFQQKVNKIPQLNSFFAKTDIYKIFQNKLEFFKKELNKTRNEAIVDLDTQITLETIHKNMNIKHEEFDLFKGFYSIFFREHSIPEEYTSLFLELLEKYRKCIVFEPSIFLKIIDSSKEFENILTEKIIQKIEKNHILSSYFKNCPQNFHKKHCKSIYTALLREDNGNLAYIRDMHKNLVINDNIFFVFKQTILSSLKEMTIDHQKIFELEEKYEEYRDDVLNTRSYYDKVISDCSLNSIIEKFYELLMENKVLKKIFKDVPIEKIKKHCEIMIIYCLKGKTKYSKCDLTPSHYKLELDSMKFNEMRNVFEKLLIWLKLNEKDILYILVDIDYYKYDVCNEKSLIKMIGGEKNIEYIVNSFYMKAFVDIKLSHYYKNTDTKKMITNQTAWFTKFFSSKTMKSFHFKDLRNFHLGMGIDLETFDFFVKNFIDCLKELNIFDANLKNDLLCWTARAKLDVLNINE